MVFLNAVSRQCVRVRDLCAPGCLAQANATAEYRTYPWALGTFPFVICISWLAIVRTHSVLDNWTWGRVWGGRSPPPGTNGKMRIALLRKDCNCPDRVCPGQWDLGRASGGGDDMCSIYRM